EGEDYRGGEARVAPKHADGVERVATKIVEETSADVARIFLVSVHTAEVTQRRTSRFVGRHSKSDALGRLRLEVVAHLIVHALVERPVVRHGEARCALLPQTSPRFRRVE